MEENDKDHKLGFLSILVLILTIYVLGAILIDSFFKLSVETSRILRITDDLICAFFLLEFFYRLLGAKNKLQFMRWGWIDLVASIPTLTYFRAGRAFRLIRLLRIARAFRTTKDFVSHIFQNKIHGALATASILAVLLIFFSSIAILQVETDPNSNIKTAEDALWWAYSTVTTVGYGDKFPVTNLGRMIGVVLMTSGVGFFGTFSGFIASWFLGGKQLKTHNKKVITKQIVKGFNKQKNPRK